jgi:hypothetical protein
MYILTQQVKENHSLLQQVLELLKNPSSKQTPTPQALPRQAAPAPTISFESLNSTQDTSSPSKVFLTWFKYNLPGAFQGEISSSTKDRTDFCRYKSLVRVYLKYGCVNGKQYPGMMPSSGNAIDEWAADLHTIIKEAETNLSDFVRGKISKKAVYQIHDGEAFQSMPYPPNCPPDLTDIDHEMSKRGSKKRKGSEID